MMCGNRSPASRPAHSYRTRTCGASCTRWRKAACARWCSAARCPLPAARHRPGPNTLRPAGPGDVRPAGRWPCLPPVRVRGWRRSGVAAGPGLPLGLGSRRARVAVEWAPSDGGRERLPPASTPTPDRSEAIRCRTSDGPKLPTTPVSPRVSIAIRPRWRSRRAGTLPGDGA